MNARARFTCICLSLLPVSLPVSAEGWVEYSTPQFQFYTDASSAAAEDWVTTLDAFTRLVPAPLHQDSAKRYRIIVVNNFSLFQKIKPYQASRGFHYRQGDIISLIVGRGIRPYAPYQQKQVILNLFKPSYLSWRLSGYPMWFSQGANLLFSSVMIEGERAIFHNYIDESFARIPATNTIALADLMFDVAAFKNPAYTPNSYAYVHYLLFGSINGYPDYRDKFSLYLSSEMKTQESFERIMGQSLAAIESNYKEYTKASGLKDVSIQLANDVKNIQQRQLSGDESNYLLADLLYQHNQYDYAQQYVKKMNKGSPQYMLLQQQYQTYNTEEEKLKNAEKALKKEPDNDALLTLVANIYWGKAKQARRTTERKVLVSKAIEHAQRALVINPDDKDMHTILRFAYASSGQRDKSFQHIKEQHRLDPENAGINFIVGRHYALENDYEKARIYLNKACQLDGKQCESTARELKEIEKRETENSH